MMSTSPRASLSGLPCSEVRISARSSRLSRISSNQRRSRLERSLAVFFAQAGNARSAASTAAVASAAASRGTLASSTPLTGLVTGVAGVPVQAPSIRHCSRSSDGSLSRDAKDGWRVSARAADADGVMAGTPLDCRALIWRLAAWFNAQARETAEGAGFGPQQLYAERRRVGKGAIPACLMDDRSGAYPSRPTHDGLGMALRARLRAPQMTRMRMTRSATPRRGRTARGGRSCRRRRPWLRPWSRSRRCGTRDRGLALPSLRKNQERSDARGFGDRPDRVWAIFSVTPNRNSAPLEATRIS